MLSEITAAISTSKAALELIKSAKDAKGQFQLHEIAIPLQQHIIDLQLRVTEVQNRYDELADKNRELKGVLAEHAQWDALAAKYEHTVAETGKHLYALKSEYTKSEPFHWICPRCYEEKKRSILQPRDLNQTCFECHPCGFIADVKKVPSVEYFTEDDPNYCKQGLWGV